jgi:hypothetical protein
MTEYSNDPLIKNLIAAATLAVKQEAKRASVALANAKAEDQRIARRRNPVPPWKSFQSDEFIILEAALIALGVSIDLG